jgi:carboxypeptidase family protein
VALADEGATVRVEIWCRRYCSIAGRAVDEQGRPAEGVSVQSSLEGNWESSQAHELDARYPRGWSTTDAEGRYFLSAVEVPGGAPAKVEITAFDRHRRSRPTVEVEVRAGETATAPDLVLDTKSLAGSAVAVVRTQDGRPIWGASVSDFGGGFARVLRTDREGRALVRFETGVGDVERKEPPGPFRLQVSAVGYAMAFSEPYLPSATAPPEVEVVLGPEHRVSGRVVRADGSPAARAYVQVESGLAPIDDVFVPHALVGRRPSAPPLPLAKPVHFGGAWSEMAAEDAGRFEVRGLPAGPYHLMASLQQQDVATGEWPTVETRLADVASDARDLVLFLPASPPAPPTGILEVAVLDTSSGRPVVRLRATLRSDRRTFDAYLTIAPGRVRIEDVPEGKWRLSVTAPGYAEWTRDGIQVPAGDEPTRVEARLDRGIELRGVAREVGGASLGKGRVFLTGLRTASLSGSIDADGRYSVTGLHAGARYRVTATSGSMPNGYPRWFSLPGDGILEAPANARELIRDLDLVLAAGIVIRMADGRAVDSARVTVLDALGAVVAEITIRKSNNTSFVVPLGEHRVRFAMEGAKPMEKPVAVVEGKTTEVLFEAP